MTSQTDQIQTLIASINALLGKSTPRLPWVMSNEVTQQRQLLAQTRDYLESLAQDLEAPGGWGPVDPASGQMTPARGAERAPGYASNRPGEAEAAQVLQALLLEMQYLKENSLKPLRQELTHLKQQRQTLQSEISTLEGQKLTADTSQQQINQFLETLMERLQTNLSQHLAETVAQVSAGQTSDRLLAETIDGELIADQPQLHPAQRLEQLRLVQSQSDQLLLKLDSTLQAVFESLQKSVESYRDSLAEGLDQMHSLGREGEVIFHALVNHIAQQLGQDTSRYLSSETGNLDAVLQSRERLAQLTAETADASSDDPSKTDLEGSPGLALDDDLADLDLSVDNLVPETEPADVPEVTASALEDADLDTTFDLPILSEADLAALQDEELTVLQADPLSLSEPLAGADADDQGDDAAIATAEPEAAVADTILNLLDDSEAVAPSVDEGGAEPLATDLSPETFETLFGESALGGALPISDEESERGGSPPAELEALADLPSDLALDRSAETSLDDTLPLETTTAEAAIDSEALAEAEAWLGLNPLAQEMDTMGRPETVAGEDGDPIVALGGDEREDTTLDSLFGTDLGGELIDEGEVDPAQDTVTSLAELLPADDGDGDEADAEGAEEDYVLAADNEDLLTLANAEPDLRPSLDLDAGLMDQLEADLQALAGDEGPESIPGAELEPLNSLLNQDELESLVADLDLAEPDALPDLPMPEAATELSDLSTADFALPDLDAADLGGEAVGGAETPEADETLPSLADLELSAEGDTLPADWSSDLTVGAETREAELSDVPAAEAESAIAAGFDLATEDFAADFSGDFASPAVDSGVMDGGLEDSLGDGFGMGEPDAVAETSGADEALTGEVLGDLTLGDLTLEDLTGLSEATEAEGADAFDAGDSIPAPLANDAAEDDLFGGSDWEGADGGDVSAEIPTESRPEIAAEATADTLFETIDFGALGSADGETESDFAPIDLATIDFGALGSVEDETGRLETPSTPEETESAEMEPAEVELADDFSDASAVGLDTLPAADDLADDLEVGLLSPELANELETLSAEANELAAQAPNEVWDGLQSDLEEPILSDLPAPAVPELADADPQLETAYLPDPLDADWGDSDSAEAVATAEDAVSELMADLSDTEPSSDELAAFAAALAAVPPTADAPPADALPADAATEAAEADLFAGFDDSFSEGNAVDRDPIGGDTDASMESDAARPVWCLGLDIGTTGLSAVLMDRSTGQVYPLYWLTAEAEEKWFRLPMTMWLSAAEGALDPAVTELGAIPVGQVAWAQAQQPDAEGVLLTGIKPLLKAAVPYQAGGEAAPQLQWSDTTTLSLAKIQQALQQLLTQCRGDMAAPLRCEAVGLEPVDFSQALQSLQAVVVGYPTNWPDTYSFNLREAVLAAGLVSRVEQIFFIEDAIATLLSGLPDPKAESVAATVRQPSLYNCNWQGATLAISAGATLTELALVDLPESGGQLSYADFGQRSFPYAGHGLDQDIICQLLAAEGVRQPLTGDQETAGQDWSWRAELPAEADGRWESLQLEELTLPAAGETALADRHRLQQRLQSSPLGLSLLEAAQHLKLILQHQSQFQLDLGSQRWLVRRRDLESRIFLPYIQRINRHLNVLLSQQGISAQAMKQVVCTGGSASLPAIARWLRQKFPNATIIQDTYASDRPQSCSRVAYGLVNLARYPQVLDITRHQYSDYFLLMELLRVFPQQPLPVSGIMHLLEQRGINTKACQLHILALLEGHLPPGLVPTPSDRPWISANSAAVETYQALTAAPLFTKQSNQIYVPNETQGQRLRDYMASVVAGKVQSLQEPLIAQLAAPVSAP